MREQATSKLFPEQQTHYWSAEARKELEGGTEAPEVTWGRALLWECWGFLIKGGVN